MLRLGPSFLGISSELQNSWLSQEIYGWYHDVVEDVCKWMKNYGSVLQLSEKDDSSCEAYVFCIAQRTWKFVDHTVLINQRELLFFYGLVFYLLTCYLCTYGLVFFLLTYVNFLHFLDNDDRMSSKRRNLPALVFLILKLSKFIPGFVIRHLRERARHILVRKWYHPTIVCLFFVILQLCACNSVARA